LPTLLKMTSHNVQYAFAPIQKQTAKLEKNDLFYSCGMQFLWQEKLQEISLLPQVFSTPSSGKYPLLNTIGYLSFQGAPAELSKQSYTTASKQLVCVIADLKGVTEEVKLLEKQLDIINAPYSIGRLPEWNGN